MSTDERRVAKTEGVPTAVSARAVDMALLDRVSHGVCVTSPEIELPGPRIEYVNDAYLDLFGCERLDVIGKNPRFAQGALTSRAALDRIRTHLDAQRSCRAQAVNYRWDRTPFRLRWSIDPVRRDDELLGYIAIMQDVTVEDRMRRRHVALDTLLSRGRSAVEAAHPDRIEALASALLGALDPLVEEIGEATVETAASGSSTAVRIDPTERLPVETIVVADRVKVSLSIHPHGASLLDRVAIEELCSQLSWLLDLARWA